MLKYFYSFDTWISHYCISHWLDVGINYIHYTNVCIHLFDSKKLDALFLFLSLSIYLSFWYLKYNGWSVAFCMHASCVSIGAHKFTECTTCSIRLKSNWVQPFWCSSAFYFPISLSRSVAFAHLVHIRYILYLDVYRWFFSFSWQNSIFFSNPINHHWSWTIHFYVLFRTDYYFKKQMIFHISSFTQINFIHFCYIAGFVH